MLKIIVMILSLLLSSAVWGARFEVVLELYDRGEYENAYKGFLELARVGNKDAQYSIAVMYLKGEGVEKDRLKGSAWLRLASQSGIELHVKTAEKYYGNLNKEERSEVDKHYSELEVEFSSEAIVNSFHPVFEVGGLKGYKKHRVRSMKTPRFPNAARYWWDSGRGSGAATIEFHIGKDGRTRFHRVVSYTNDIFVDTSVTSAQKILYEPAEKDGNILKTFAVRQPYSFHLEGVNFEWAALSTLAPLKNKAISGTSVDRLNYARALEVSRHFISEKNISRFGNSTQWNLKAAIDGHPHGMYELGLNLIAGHFCRADPEKGYYWLESAANDGVKEAQLTLGLELFYGGIVEENKAEGLKWIQRAADAGDETAMQYYAQIYALYGGVSGATRDLAWHYLDQVKYKELYDKLSYYEIKAALYSEKGAFRKAIGMQKRAIKQAVKLKLNTDFLWSNMDRLKDKKRVLVIDNED